MKNEIIELIKELSVKAGMSFDKMYVIMMHQVSIDILMYIINYVCLTVGGMFLWKWTKRWLAGDLYDLGEMIIFVCLLVYFVWAMVSLISIWYCVTAIVNPEYYIVNSLLSR